jgi:hypothetical protein
MELVTRKELEELAVPREGLHLSLLLPVPLTDFRQAPIRLKNLLRAADVQLSEAGAEPAARDQLLDAAWETALPVLEAPAGARTLALFVAPGFARCVRLHAELEERIEVLGRFYLRPLFAALDEVASFCLLALSINRARLYEVSPSGIRRLDVSDLPPDMQAALGYTEFDSDLQVHSAAPGLHGARSGIVHGHGDGDEERFKTDLAGYFRRVAQAVAAYAGARERQVLLATVAVHVPIFRQVATGLDLLPEVLHGSPDHLTDEELRRLAVALLEARHREAATRAAERYAELRGTKRTAEEPAAVLAAAASGRMEVLLMARDAELWGHFDPATGILDAHEVRAPGEDDLVELAALDTLRSRGRVHVLQASKMPVQQPLAAILRY